MAGLSGVVVCESAGRMEDERVVEAMRGMLKRALRDIVMVLLLLNRSVR